MSSSNNTTQHPYGSAPRMVEIQPAVVGIQNHNYYSSASQLPNNTEPNWLCYVEANKEHIDTLLANFYHLDQKVDAGERQNQREVRSLGREVISLRNKMESIEGARQVAMGAVSQSLRDLDHGVQEIRDVRNGLEECRQSVEATQEETARVTGHHSEEISNLRRGLDYYGYRVREQDSWATDQEKRVDDRLEPLEQKVEKILQAMEEATFDEAPWKVEEESAVEYMEDVDAVPTVSAPTIDAETTSTIFASTMNSLLATVQKLQDDSAADREKSQSRMLALEKQVRVLSNENSEYRVREEKMQTEIDNLNARLTPTPEASWTGSSGEYFETEPTGDHWATSEDWQAGLQGSSSPSDGRC